jgi:hypothetical protein
LDQQISVRVTYTDDGGTVESLTSTARVVAPKTIKVTTFDDVVDATDRVISLREAEIEANLRGDTLAPTTIELGVGRYNLTLASRSADNTETDASYGDMDITGSMIIRGPYAGNTVIENAMGSRAFQVHTGATPALEHLSIDQGYRMKKSFAVASFTVS